MNRNKAARVTGGAILLVALVVTLAARATVVSGIVGWWLFNDGYGITALDSSGQGNNGTLVSTAFFTTDPQRGNVLNVNGAPGEVDFPFSTSLQPATGTVMVWVKPTLAQTADLVRQTTDLLVRSNQGGTFYAYCLRVNKNGSPVAIIANDDPKTNGKYPQIVVTGPSRVKLNQWTHLAMRWDGSTLSLFLNGKLAGSSPYSAVPNLGLSYHGTAPLKVAAAIWDFNNGYLEYQGLLSDLRIYSRALGDTEIYNVSAGQ